MKYRALYVFSRVWLSPLYSHLFRVGNGYIMVTQTASKSLQLKFFSFLVWLCPA